MVALRSLVESFDISMRPELEQLAADVIAKLPQPDVAKCLPLLFHAVEPLGAAKALTDSALSRMVALDNDVIAALELAMERYGVDAVRGHVQRIWSDARILPFIAFHRHIAARYPEYAAEWLVTINEAVVTLLQRGGKAEGVVDMVGFLLDSLPRGEDLRALFDVLAALRHDVNSASDPVHLLLSSEAIWQRAESKPLIDELLNSTVNQRLQLLADSMDTFSWSFPGRGCERVFAVSHGEMEDIPRVRRHRGGSEIQL